MYLIKKFNYLAFNKFQSESVRYAIYLSCDAISNNVDILTRVDLDEPVQPLFKLKNSQWCSINSLTVIEYLSD